MTAPMTVEQARQAVLAWAGSWSSSMNPVALKTFADELAVYPADQVEAALRRARAEWEQSKHPPLKFVLDRIPQAAPAQVEVRPIDYSVDVLRNRVIDRTPPEVWESASQAERETHARAVLKCGYRLGPEERERFNAGVRPFLESIGCAGLTPQPVQHSLEEPPDPFAEDE